MSVIKTTPAIIRKAAIKLLESHEIGNLEIYIENLSRGFWASDAYGHNVYSFSHFGTTCSMSKELGDAIIKEMKTKYTRKTCSL